MQFMYKTLNKVQTQVITWGDPFDCSGSDVIICVTGNPGVPDFYIEFGTELHTTTGLPVCVLGQAGHVQVPDEESNFLVNRECLYNLEGQIAHKLDLINKYVDKSSRLHLIGHSIGAWMLLELLKKYDDIYTRTLSVQLLFPTLQKMAETENGYFLNKILRKINFLLILMVALICMWPYALKEFMIKLYLKYYSLPQHYVGRIMKYINPAVIDKVLFLAYDEMDQVRELNIEAIEKVKHLTNVIYSSKDGWAPVGYMDPLKPFQPQLLMKQVDIDHAFVLKSSETVAEMVSSFIKSKS